MIITLNELFKGKSTIIKNNTFLATRDYCEPFIEEMSKYTNNFNIKVIEPKQITVDEDKDITYNRVLIEAILPKEHTIDNHDEVIGFLYGLDIKKPVTKIYRGYINRACTNLSVFDPKWISYKEIKPQAKFKHDVKALLERDNDFAIQLKQLKDTYVDRVTLKNKLGKWVDFTLVNDLTTDIHSIKLSTNLPIKGYSSLVIDEDSKYLLKPDQDPSLFDIHEAMTQVITDDKKDIISHFEKTLLVNQMLQLN